MTFRLESEMLDPVVAWLTDSGYFVKTEYRTPWGICDLVAAKFYSNRIKQRIKLNQRKTIGLLSKVALLYSIPDQASGKSRSLKKLYNDFGLYLDSDILDAYLQDLERKNFIFEVRKGIYQKNNGWEPLHQQIISIELKLSRIQDAIDQAIKNSALTGQTYVGFPLEVSNNIYHSTKIDEFKSAGIGILGITKEKCVVLLPPRPNNNLVDPVLELHAAERFWPELLQTV